MRDGIVLVRLSLLLTWRTGREELTHIYYLIDKEHEYEAQDEGDSDDVRDRIVLVHLTPSPSSSPLLLEDRVREVSTLCAYINNLVDEEHEYEALDE